MSDNNVFGMVVVAIISILIGGLIFGTKIENNRLYDRCMKENENTLHVEAKKLCEERTR